MTARHPPPLARGQDLVRKILQNGGSARSLTSYEWDVSGDCQFPRTVWRRYATGQRMRHWRSLEQPEVQAFLRAMPPGSEVLHLPPNRRKFFGTTYAGKGSPAISMDVTMHVRCRECDKCLAQRRRVWTARAAKEIDFATRTWFGTLTLSPENHFKIQARACRRLDLKGTAFESLPPGEQFQLRANEIGREVTLFQKRIRTNSGARLRALWVMEKHKSGLPHVHYFLHEIGIATCQWKIQSAAWPLGFVKIKLVRDAKQASYITKYIAKNALIRIRASKHYGDPLGLGVGLEDGLSHSENKTSPTGLSLQREKTTNESSAALIVTELEATLP